MAATPLPPFDEILLARFLAEASGARNVGITEPELLAGGAIQENWDFTARFIGGPMAGDQELVLRTDAPTGTRGRGRCSNGRSAGSKPMSRPRWPRCCATAISAPATTCWTAPS